MSIEAMKQALELLEIYYDLHEEEADAKAITSLRQAIAEAEKQEPVAVVWGYYGGQCVILPLDPARIFNSNTAFYTSPPQRQWVGLTADELNMIWDRMKTWNSHSWTDIYIAIEAKLKEKNGIKEEA